MRKANGLKITYYDEYLARMLVSASACTRLAQRTAFEQLFIRPHVPHARRSFTLITAADIVAIGAVAASRFCGRADERPVLAGAWCVRL